MAASGLLARHVHVSLLQRSGGWLSPEKVKTLQKGVMAAGDGLDDLTDGIISNVQACSATFDPVTLRCEGGQSKGDGCFSDAEILVIKAMHAPYELGFPVANGMTSHPGWGYGGETQPGGMIELLTGAKPPAFPPLSVSEQSQSWIFANAAVEYFLAKDPKFDPANFAPQARKRRLGRRRCVFKMLFQRRWMPTRRRLFQIARAKLS